MRKSRVLAGTTLWVLILLPSYAGAQTPPLPPEVARHGYADLIVVNGKMVSMDDRGLNTNVGNVYEAMAVKGNRIMALGPSERIRALADANTRVIDLQGQTVIPGIIETHAHLFGNPRLAAQMGLRSPDKGINVSVKAGRDVEGTRLLLENAIRDSLSRVQPDEWIIARLTPNPEEGVSAVRLDAWFSGDNLETRERLDRLAPDNPVLARAGRRGILSSKGWELATEAIPAFTDFMREARAARDEDTTQLGLLGPMEMASLSWDIWYRQQPVSLFAEMFRQDLEMAVAHGVTTFSSRVPHPRIMDGFLWLNRENQMPLRFAMLYEVHRQPKDPQMTRQFYRMTGNLTGLGNDYLWIHGVASELWDASFPEACLGPDLEAPPKIKAREMCPSPGEMYWDTLQNALEAGWRLAGIHGNGSHAVRLFVQMIETVMQKNGMTVEDVRRLRLTVEHAEVLGNLPDVVEGLKKYGIIVSAGPPRLLREPEYLQDYGPAVDSFMLPVRSWLNQGIKVVGQNHSYRNIGYYWTVFMTRQVEGGKAILPEEKLDRVTVLKMWTPWAAEYVLREDDLGTLEVGKLADFLVLDKDYFTIPVAEIPDIRPQMTVVGGAIKFLGQEFAAKLGRETVGYQFPEGYSPWGEVPWWQR